MKMTLVVLTLLMTVSSFAEIVEGKPSNGRTFVVMGESFLFDPETGAEQKGVKKAAAIESAEDIAENECLKIGKNTEIQSTVLMSIVEGLDEIQGNSQPSRHYVAKTTAKCTK